MDSCGKQSSTTIQQLAAELHEFKTWNEKLAVERVARLDARIDASEDQTAQAFASSDKAIQKAEAAQKNAVSSARFDDFRKEYEAYKLSQASEIRGLRESRSTAEGVAGGRAATWATVITIAGAIGAVIGFLIRKLPG